MVKTLSLELNASYRNYDQSRVRPAFQDPKDKGEGLYPPQKGPKTKAKGLTLLT